MPSIEDHRRIVDIALEQQDLTTVRRHLDILWRAVPGPALAGFVVSRYAQIYTIEQSRAAFVYLLRSATLEPVVPVLRADAAVHGLGLDVALGDFNAYAQEILTPGSNLYLANPHVVVLAVQTADVAPELWNTFADLTDDAIAAAALRVCSLFSTLVETFRKQSTAHLIIHTLELPTMPVSGVYDSQSLHGQAHAIHQINAVLSGIVRQYPGVYVLDYDALVARHGRVNWHDSTKWRSHHIPLHGSYYAALAREWVRFLLPLSGRVCKALVVDLDNTLWQGVLGDDGAQGLDVSPFRELQRVILDLYRRGIILAICSKNSAAIALDTIDTHPDMLLRKKHFAAWHINWDDKATGLRRIADELNIGLDAIAFLDDNPAERDLIRQQLPQVTVIDLPPSPYDYADALRACPLFERLTITDEDRLRGRQYAEQRERAGLQYQTESLDAYLHSLKTTLTIRRVTESTVARAAQLTQKTNQLNVTTKRYTEQELLVMLNIPDWYLFVVAAADRFGDHGHVGLVFVYQPPSTPHVWYIDTLVLSCRVIGREIETAMLASVADAARRSAVESLIGIYLPTAKNEPARDIFKQAGFTQFYDQAEVTKWQYRLADQTLRVPSWIQVTS